MSCYPSPSISHSSRTPAPSDSETSESSDFRMSSFSPSNDPLLDDKHCKEKPSYFDIHSTTGGDGECTLCPTHCTPSGALHIAIVDSNDCSSSSDDDEHSVSMSQCRYCYADTLREHNVSQCHCSGTLCKECLVKELQLTYGRKDQLLQCTVCKVECIYLHFHFCTKIVFFSFWMWPRSE